MPKLNPGFMSNLAAVLTPRSSKNEPIKQTWNAVLLLI